MVETSVIVLNYNGGRFLETCLSSVLKQDYKNYEVILVDNNSADNSVSLVKKKFPKVRILRLKENLGFTGGNNEGAKSAKAEKYLIFLNNDTKVENTWLSELVKQAESSEKIGLVNSKIYFYDSKLLNSVGGKINAFFVAKDVGFNKKDNGSYDNADIDFVCGCSFLIKKHVLEKLGYLFDPSYFIYYDDVDLSLRAKKAGYALSIAPKSVVYHYGSATMKNLSYNSVFWSTRNKYKTIIRNKKQIYLVPALLWDFFVFVSALIKKDKNKAKAKLDVFKWLLRRMK